MRPIAGSAKVIATAEATGAAAATAATRQTTTTARTTTQTSKLSCNQAISTIRYPAGKNTSFFTWELHKIVT